MAEITEYSARIDTINKKLKSGIKATQEELARLNTDNLDFKKIHQELLKAFEEYEKTKEALSGQIKSFCDTITSMQFFETALNSTEFFKLINEDPNIGNFLENIDFTNTEHLALFQLITLYVVPLDRLIKFYTICNENFLIPPYPLSEYFPQISSYGHATIIGRFNPTLTLNSKDTEKRRKALSLLNNSIFGSFYNRQNINMGVQFLSDQELKIPLKDGETNGPWVKYMYVFFIKDGKKVTHKEQNFPFTGLDLTNETINTDASSRRVISERRLGGIRIKVVGNKILITSTRQEYEEIQTALDIVGSLNELRFEGRFNGDLNARIITDSSMDVLRIPQFLSNYGQTIHRNFLENQLKYYPLEINLRKNREEIVPQATHLVEPKVRLKNEEIPFESISGVIVLDLYVDNSEDMEVLLEDVIGVDKEGQTIETDKPTLMNEQLHIFLGSNNEPNFIIETLIKAYHNLLKNESKEIPIRLMKVSEDSSERRNSKILESFIEELKNKLENNENFNSIKSSRSITTTGSSGSNNKTVYVPKVIEDILRLIGCLKRVPYLSSDQFFGFLKESFINQLGLENESANVLLEKLKTICPTVGEDLVLKANKEKYAAESSTISPTTPVPAVEPVPASTGKRTKRVFKLQFTLSTKEEVAVDSLGSIAMVRLVPISFVERKNSGSQSDEKGPQEYYEEFASDSKPFSVEGEESLVSPPVSEEGEERSTDAAITPPTGSEAEISPSTSVAPAKRPPPERESTLVPVDTRIIDKVNKGNQDKKIDPKMTEGSITGFRKRINRGKS